MVIKGRIHGELGKFEIYLCNSVKSDNELRLEIGRFSILRKITKLRIHGIKNQVIWIRIRRVIEVEVRRKFVSRFWLKTEIKLKLNLIYNSKFKINAKWWKIKMKTNNLTQISLWNDPINRRMQGFSFRIFEDKSGVQDLISSNSFDQTLKLNIQWKRKWVANTGK